MTDFIVIGGGIAGVSAAAYLAPHGSVTLLERETVLGYHATGRSAAMFRLNYPDPGARRMARASYHFLQNPPPGSTDAPLLSERGLLWVADHGQMADLEKSGGGGETSTAGQQLLSAREVIEMVPVMRRDRTAGGLYETTALDLDVAGLHQAFVRIARRQGVEIRTRAEVTAIDPIEGSWRVTVQGVPVRCRAVINAAGAWGDEVAAMAGVEPLGLRSLRRTVFMVPGNPDFARWPMVVDAQRRFYFKPDGVQLLCSPAEEEFSVPMDTRPRTEDIALAIERINRATKLGIRSVNSQWTGLRTFAPDRELVVGEEPGTPGFFWLVGQGGTGIRTAPAYGALLASQVADAAPPDELAAAGVDPDVIHPARFRF